MAVKNWHKQWEEKLISSLEKYEIAYEKTSFKISSDLKRVRDDDWNTTINSGQIITVVKPKRKGGKLKLQSINANGLPVLVGTVEFYNEEREYQRGIVCQMVEKTLDYASGKTRTCLEFDQPIILIESNHIPSEILESKTLRIKTKASKSGCCSGILLSITFILFLAYLALSV